MNPIAKLLSTYYEEITPYNFYREIFPEGELDQRGQYTKGKFCGIAIEVTNQPKKNKKNEFVAYRHTVTDDLDVVKELENSTHFCIMAPISYVGKSRCSENARIYYALCVELDNLKVKSDGEQIGLEVLIEQFSDRVHWIPKPTFLVSSGNGVHLYYVFDKPLMLYPNTIQSLRNYKEELTKMIWNRKVTTTYTQDTIQQESIFQAFRMPGTKTKSGDVTRAYRCGDKVSVDYMNKFVFGHTGNPVIEPTYRSEIKLEDAKKKYPEWYQKVIVEKDRSRKKWAINRAVYDWWFRTIDLYAADGHRYYCLMMLSIYAIKCGNYDPQKNPNPVTQEELERDAWSLLDDFNGRGTREDNPFTEHDVMCALQVYEDKDMFTYPKNLIEHRSGIEIIPSVPRKKKGERQKQEWHLEDIRAKKANMKKRDQPFKRPEGRPVGSGTAEKRVADYRLVHPDHTVTQVAHALDLSRPTVYRWWDVSINE